MIKTLDCVAVLPSDGLSNACHSPRHAADATLLLLLRMMAGRLRVLARGSYAEVRLEDGST